MLLRRLLFIAAIYSNIIAVVAVAVVTIAVVAVVIIAIVAVACFGSLLLFLLVPLLFSLFLLIRCCC